MSDTGPVAARPKLASTPEQDKRMGLQQASHLLPEEKRGPGRPPKPQAADPFTVLTLIASTLRTVEKPLRKQILETLLALSE